MTVCVEEDSLALHISGAQMVLKMGRGRLHPTKLQWPLDRWKGADW